jgi:hypothetical protein
MKNLSLNDKQIIQGRHISQSDIDEIRTLLRCRPNWSRWKLSRYLSDKWDWRNGLGQLKDMACRSLLLKLEHRGYINLPERRCVSPNPMNKNKDLTTTTITPVQHNTQPIEESLVNLQPFSLLPLHLHQHCHYRPLFDFLLFKYHYLGYRGSVGENLQYLVLDRLFRPLSCLLFGSAAWKVSCRDVFIGWNRETRGHNVNLITNNMRFLILPWVRVKYLASHILGGICRRIGKDWQEKYGHGIYLVETYVEKMRFAGSCYKAANWLHLGETTGRSRNDRYNNLRVPVKNVYVYPLRKNFRHYLNTVNGKW